MLGLTKVRVLRLKVKLTVDECLNVIRRTLDTLEEGASD
jgi:hypothetical protein